MTETVTVIQKENKSIVYKLGVFLWAAATWVWKSLLHAIGFILFAAILFIAVVFLFGNSNHGNERNVLVDGNYAKDGEIVVLNLTGQIVEKSIPSDPPFSFDTQTIGSDQVKKTLHELAKDESVKGVILSINSPGGGVVASDLVYTAVRDFAQKKPVVAVIGEAAASGGYYIAVGADHIVAHPSSVIGSIGVIGVFPNISGLLDTLGIDMQVIQTGKYKDTGSAFRAMSGDEQKIIQRLVDEALEEFVAAVDEGRELTREEVEALADGRIMSGRQALQLGLIDSLGNQDDAFKIIKELADVSDPILTEYKSGGFLESLFSMVGQKIQMSQLLGLQGMALNQSLVLSQALQNKPGLYYMSEL
jgi:protease-4